MSDTLYSPDYVESLLQHYIQNEALRHHGRMVGKAVKAYAQSLKLDDDTVAQWWAAGTLHDLDWEYVPDQHPLYAVDQILRPAGYPEPVLQAILSHAPERSGRQPESALDRFLFACDELSGFMHAVSLMRPEGFKGMQVKSVRKKLKDLRFAANVSREDIQLGADLIEKDLDSHISFLIDVFQYE